MAKLQNTEKCNETQPTKKEQALANLISREEVIDHLNSIVEASSTNADYSEGFVDGINFSVGFVSVVKPALTNNIVYCKNCMHRTTIDCPMFHHEYVDYMEDCDYINHDYTEDYGWCHKGVVAK